MSAIWPAGQPLRFVGGDGDAMSRTRALPVASMRPELTAAGRQWWKEHRAKGRRRRACIRALSSAFALRPGLLAPLALQHLLLWRSRKAASVLPPARGRGGRAYATANSPALSRSGMADGEGGDRDAAGHLHDGIQRVHATQRSALHGHSSAGTVVMLAAIPGRCAAPPGPRDDAVQPARLGARRVVVEQLGRAMRADDLLSKGTPKFCQHLGGVLHGRPVRAGTHDDAHDRGRARG